MTDTTGLEHEKDTDEKSNDGNTEANTSTDPWEQPVEPAAPIPVPTTPVPITHPTTNRLKALSESTRNLGRSIGEKTKVATAPLIQNVKSLDEKHNVSARVTDGAKHVGTSISEGTKKVGTNISEGTTKVGASIGERTKHLRESVKSLDEKHNVTGSVTVGTKAVGSALKGFNEKYNLTGSLAGMAAGVGIWKAAHGDAKGAGKAMATAGVAAMTDAAVKTDQSGERS